MLVQVELRILCSGDLTLQVNYAAGRIVAVIVYCFSGDLNYWLSQFTWKCNGLLINMLTVTGTGMTG